MDRKIQISLPRESERHGLLKIHSMGKKMDSAVDLENFAKQTVGFSGADLSNALNEAVILAVRRNGSSIKIIDIQQAYDTVTIGIQLDDRLVDERTDKIVCVHESGHALVLCFQDGYNKVSRISSIPSSAGTGGFMLCIPDEMRRLSSQRKC